MTKNAKHSALLVAGAAAAVAAAYIGRRHLSVVKSRIAKPGNDELVPLNQLVAHNDVLIERDSPELPVGRSADPQIDDFIPPKRSPRDETSGGMWRGETEPPAETPTEVGLDEIWNALPGFAEGEQTEGYDAVAPEDLGTVWLERATQTTHDERPHASDPNDIPGLNELLVSDETLPSSRAGQEQIDEDDEYDEEDDELEPDDDEQ